MDIFPKEKIIYLTAESPNLIENIEDDGAYIIGGLVDHNSQKVCSTYLLLIPHFSSFLSFFVKTNYFFFIFRDFVINLLKKKVCVMDASLLRKTLI